ncbi:MAG: cell wall-binding repeat-containing protein, partial [Acidimicrobiales bacterium]
MRSTPAWMRRLVVGGVSAVTMAGVGVVGLSVPAGATSSFHINTLAGPNRFATAAAIATAAYPNGAATVIVASGLTSHISDSLAASYLAGQLNGGKGAPILLSEPDTIPPETLAALKTLGATHVIVVGGSSAVSDTAISALTSAGLIVNRVAGPDRFATSMALDSVVGSTKIGTAGGGAGSGGSTTSSNGVTLTSSQVQPGGTVNGI